MNSIRLTNREILLLLSVKGIGFERLKVIVSLEETFKEIQGWDRKKWTSLFGKVDILSEFRNIPTSIIKLIDDSIHLADKTISYWDQDYPSALKEIVNPPPILFLKGNISLLTTKCISIIGTRNITSYGKFSTFYFTNELVDHSYTIVSGFARGVDSLAHRTAVQQNGRTIAVLGCGLDVIYPKENKLLYESILENNGLLVSEFLIKTKPDAPNFPKRNRIIAALSDAILVIEAGKKSGSLITAEMALEYGKDIFALPGQINSKQSEGTNHLIKDGAYLVQGIEDITSILNPPRKAEKQLDLFAYTESQQSLLNILSSEPKHIDTIINTLDKPFSELYKDILFLELNNKITDVGGKCYILNF